MDIVDVLMNFTLLGARWVLWLLIALSVLSVAMIFERLRVVWPLGRGFDGFIAQLESRLAHQDVAGALVLAAAHTGVESRIVRRGLERWRDGGGRHSVTEVMESWAIRERRDLEAGQTFLATLGANAPFVGLFGTVLGIIQAFADLASNPGGGPSVVMASISEALVATAVGLLVAIPAVVAFNTFSRRTKVAMANVDAAIHVLGAYNPTP